MMVTVVESSEKQECAWDEEDKLVSCFTRYEVFHQTENLVAVTTGDVAREEIKSDLLGTEEIGKTVVKEFVQDRLIKKDLKFHDSVKQQKLKTFETLYSHSAPFSTQVCKWEPEINAGGEPCDGLASIQEGTEIL